MKLLERYSTQCGLRIGKQFLLEKFYPLADDRPYILLHSSSGMPGKNYPYYNDVMDLLAPILLQNHIAIYQIGGPQDPPIKHCVHLQGKTSVHQTNYLIKRALALIGNDSWTSHRAGHLGIPVIEVFGPTEADNHAPYEYHPASIFIRSHRNGNKPSFGSNENPLTLGLIPPEVISNCFLRIVNTNYRIDRKTYLMGRHYGNTIIEWVPDNQVSPDFLKDQPLVCRYDYLKESSQAAETNLAHCLQSRQLNIVTDKEIDLRLVAGLKGNIRAVNYRVKLLDNPEYIKALKKTGVRVIFFTDLVDKKLVSELRFKFFDIASIDVLQEKSIENFVQESEQFTREKLDLASFLAQNNDLWFRSNKYILARGKAYLSKAHFNLDLPTNSLENNIMQVVDSPDFWKEIDHMYIFKQKVTK